MHLSTTSLSGRAIQTRGDGWTQIEQIYLGVVSNNQNSNPAIKKEGQYTERQTEVRKASQRVEES